MKFLLYFSLKINNATRSALKWDKIYTEISNYLLGKSMVFFNIKT